MIRFIISLLVFSLFLLSGCTPDINRFEVVDAEDGGPPKHEQTLQGTAEVTVKSGGAETPEVSWRPVAPADETYEPLGSLPDQEEIGNNQVRFSGNLSGLNYGAYDFLLKVPYSAWLQRLTTSTTLRVTVAAPETCFSFRSGEPGFTMGDVRKSDGSSFSQGVAAGVDQFNWPVEAPRDYSRYFQITTDKFPTEEDEPFYWFIDFISPDLTEDESWQNSNGVTFRATTRGQRIWAQPVFLINDNYWAPKDPVTNKFLVYPISDPSERQWNVMNWDASPPLPAGVRQAIHIRIYGDAKLTALNQEESIYLDGVCPIPPGISPPGGKVVEPIPHPMQ